MADRELTQTEANALLEMPKKREDEVVRLFPVGGRGIVVPLVSHDETEKFLLDVTRGWINLQKATYQTRSRQVIILARLDLSGPPHRNPDDEEIPCPHLHLYREGFADKWAVPAPVTEFPHPQDMWESLHDFMRFCQITDLPRIERGLQL